MSGKPRPVWVDGDEVDSITTASVEMGVDNQRQYREFRKALHSGETYNGRRLSLVPQEKIQEEKEVVQMKKEVAPGVWRIDPLLRGHITHRLGVYRDGRW